jgi:hypothetical protein
MSAVIPQEHFRITRDDPKMYARQTSPTKTMECWFCADCGTRLYHMPGGASYANRNVKPGTLDDTAWLTPTLLDAQRSKKMGRIPEGETRYEMQPESLPARLCGGRETGWVFVVH